jgi:inner membrane protein
MPTPVGHALAGLATAWVADALAPLPRRPTAEAGVKRTFAALGGGLALACVVLAASPDLDILTGTHRAASHSLGAALVVGLGAALVARRWQLPVLRTAVTCGAAYATHVLLDWLGMDSAPPYGIVALWPASSAYYTSGADLFLEISRRYWKADEFIVGNLESLAWELLILGPIAAAAWWLRARTRRRGQGTRGVTAPHTTA